MNDLHGVKVAILIDNGFEHDEMVKPRQALEDAGAQTKIVSPQAKQVRSWKMKEWGDEFPVDVALEHANADDFDALLLPGGVINPDKLRMQAKAVAFAKAFFEAQKPVAAICHGPWMVIEAGKARGRQIVATPAPIGWIRRWWWTEILCPAASLTTFQRSIGR